MASVGAGRSVALVLLFVFVSATGAAADSNKKLLNITNSCRYNVWPGVLSGAGSTAALETTGFALAPGQWKIVLVPSRWSGRIWGRTFCTTDAGTGKFSCATGDCGSGNQDCAGGGPAPPATIAELTMDGSGSLDFYDVSLVDGFNLPMSVAPQQGAAAPGGNNCTPAGCAADLNDACPAELRVTSAAAAAAGAVACKSACQAFGSPQYCCTGEYGNPGTCEATAYSQFFKSVCPQAFSYAYDSAASTFTCGGGGDTTYTITFCPSTTSGAKSSSSNSQPPLPEAGDLPHIDVTVVANTGGKQFPAWGVVAGTLSVLAVVLGAIFGCFRYIIKRRAQSAAAASEK